MFGPAVHNSLLCKPPGVHYLPVAGPSQGSVRGLFQKVRTQGDGAAEPLNR